MIFSQILALSEKVDSHTAMLSSCLDGISRVGSKKKTRLLGRMDFPNDCGKETFGLLSSTSFQRTRSDVTCEAQTHEDGLGCARPPQCHYPRFPELLKERGDEAQSESDLVAWATESVAAPPESPGGFRRASTMMSGWSMPARSRHPMLARIWQFFEYSHFSRGALAYYYAINLTILACVLLSWLDIVYPGQGASVAQWPLETWFLVEVLVRFIASPNRALFVLNLYNLIDLIVLLQVTARLVNAVSNTRDGEVFYQTIKVFFPPLMLLKLVRRFPSFNLLLSAFYNAVAALPVLLYTMMVVVFAFAGLIYLAEPRTNIPGIADALWLTCVSMSTLGYGDVTPVSTLGKFWTGCLLVVGALYMAIPIGIVGNAFSKIWEDRDRLFILCDIRDRVVQAGITPADLFHIYQELDQDKDGQLSLQEFKAMFTLLDIKIGDHMSARIFDKLDADGEGTIDFEEMLVGMFPTHKIILMIQRAASQAKNSTTEVVLGRVSVSDSWGDAAQGQKTMGG